MSEKAAFKQQLIESCLHFLSGKMKDLEHSLKELQDNANDETKSSMGDKYETGRSMIMLEKEKLLAQHENIRNQFEVLSKLKPELSDTVKPGSLIRANNSNYFISVGLGKIQFNNQNFFLISPASPIAKEMMNRKQDESFQFNAVTWHIEKVY